MARMRRRFFRLVLASVLVAAMYTLFYEIPHLASHSETVFLIQSDTDVCAEWINVFPSDTIIIVSSNPIISRNRNSSCTYTTKRPGSVDPYLMALGFHPSRVILVSGRLQPRTCSLDDASSRPTILYKASADHVFDSSAHFGYGGVTHEDQMGTYLFSRGLNIPVLRVLSAVYAPEVMPSVFPPMALGAGAFIRTENSCLVVSRKAFWALPLLGEAASEKQRTSLGFLAQKLIWKTGQVIEHHVRFTSVLKRFSSKAGDTTFEESVFARLHNSSCDRHLSTCIRMLAGELQDSNFTTKTALQELEIWLAKIQKTTVNVEQMLDLGTSAAKTPSQEIKSYSVQPGEVQFDFKKSPSESSTWYFDINRNSRKIIEKGKCGKSSVQSKIPLWTQWTNILVIVTFNRPHYDTIPLYETLYRPFFPHMVYCGPSLPNMTTPDLASFSFSFITFDRQPNYLNNGSLNYECLMKASKLGYRVDGYFQVADDVLLLPHRLQHFDTDKVWTWRFDNMVRVNYENNTFCDDTGCQPENVSFWFTHQNNTLKALNALQELQKESSTVRRCAANIGRYFGGPMWSLRILSDITYVPSRFIPEVTELLGIFLKYEVYLEIAIPTVLHCIIPQDEIQPIYTHFHNMASPEDVVEYSPLIAKPHRPDLVLMSHRNYTHRDKVWLQASGRLFNGITFYHPHKKMAVVRGSKSHIEFYCRFLGFLRDPSGNFSRVAELVNTKEEEPEHWRKRRRKNLKANDVNTQPKQKKHWKVCTEKVKGGTLSCVPNVV